MQHLRANTAVKVPIGPFVDVGDGFTPETGITLGAADEAELIKHDASGGTDISALTWAAYSTTAVDGYYALSLTATETNTEGMLTIVVQDDSVCLPVVCRFMVLSEAAYDSLYVAKDDGFMDVNIKTIGRADTQETEADNLESACSNYSATRGLSGTALPAAAAGAAGGLPTDSAGKTSFNDIAATAIVSSGAITTSGGAVSTVTNTTQLNGAATVVLTDASSDAVLADAIWNAATATYGGVGSYGELVESGNVGGGAIVAASVTGAVGSVTGAVGSVTGAVGSVTGNVGGNVVGSVASVTAAVTIDGTSVDLIWDETMTAHVTADSAAVALKDVLVDTAEIGTAGAGLTNINLPDQTMNITGDITGNLSGSVGSVTGAVGSVTGNVGGNVTGSVGSNLELGPAEVNAEVLDVLQTDVFAQVGQETPAATQSILKMIQYLYKAWRNKKDQDGSTTNLYNDDASTVDHKQTTSEAGGTVTAGEWTTGP